MPTPEKLTADIQLPLQSNVMDPRLNTPWYAAARRAATKPSTAAPTRSGGIRAAVSKATDNFRTFTGKGRS